MEVSLERKNMEIGSGALLPSKFVAEGGFLFLNSGFKP